jgi:hypothetical protein
LHRISASAGCKKVRFSLESPFLSRRPAPALVALTASAAFGFIPTLGEHGSQSLMPQRAARPVTGLKVGTLRTPFDLLTILIFYNALNDNNQSKNN